MSYPPGYPLASSADAQVARNGGDSRAINPTKDLRSSPRLSSRKLAVISARLSDRDRQILKTVARFRVMSGEQLGRLFWPEGLPATRARLARHGLARLSRLGVLAPLSRRVGGVRAGSTGLCFGVGLAGQRLLPRSGKRPRSPHTPGERYLRHHLAVADLYVELTEAQRHGLTELLAFEPEPGCWRDFAGGFGVTITLKPDAYAKLGGGEYEYSWLIEIDRATEALTTITRKGQRHLNYHRSGAARRTHGVSARVLWIAPDQQRAERLQEALDQLKGDTDRLFVVTTSVDAIGLLLTERVL